MKKTILKFCTFVSLTLLLTACPYNSEVPIDEPTVKIDDKLIGKWEAKNSGDYFYYVTKKDDFTYKFEKKGKKNTESTVYTGFLSVIDGVKFMNVYEDNSSAKSYYLYKIEQSAAGPRLRLFRLHQILMKNLPAQPI